MNDKNAFEGSENAAQEVEKEASSRGIEKLPARLERYAKARSRSLAMSAYLHGLKKGDKGPLGAVSGPEASEARKVSGKLSDCGEWLHFRHFYTVDQLRLVAGQFCQQTKLCPLCAIRRASKTLARYLDRFRVLLANASAEGVELHPYLITLTVKNGPDLTERMGHLRKAWKRLVDRRRQALSGNGRGKTLFRHVLAAVGSFEVTNRGKGWHPHMHLIALCDRPIDGFQLSREWQISTKDSFIVDVKPIAKTSDMECVVAFCEVFKYSMKFSDMPLPENWIAHRLLKGKRLTVSIGGFFGLKEAEETEDSCEDLSEMPYVDLFFNYLANSRVYTYDRTRSESAERILKHV